MSLLNINNSCFCTLANFQVVQLIYYIFQVIETSTENKEYLHGIFKHVAAVIKNVGKNKSNQLDGQNKINGRCISDSLLNNIHEDGT